MEYDIVMKSRKKVSQLRQYYEFIMRLYGYWVPSVVPKWLCLIPYSNVVVGNIQLVQPQVVDLDLSLVFTIRRRILYHTRAFDSAYFSSIAIFFFSLSNQYTYVYIVIETATRSRYYITIFVFQFIHLFHWYLYLSSLSPQCSILFVGSEATTIYRTDQLV